MTINIIDWDGKPISKPGVYSGIDLDTYHSQYICAGPSVSSSNLRRVLERNEGSPAHFYAEWSGNPKRVETDEKKHHIIGRAVHHLLLGEVGFARSFAIRPDEIIDRRTGELRKWNANATAAKEWLAKAKADGRAVLSPDDIEDIKGMAMSIGSHPEINVEYKPGRYYSLLNGHIEKSFIWRDKRTGLYLKARPDAVPTDSGDYADLKTTTSVHLGSVARAIADFAYHQQAALIGEGSRECAGIEMSSYTLVFVEKRAPYCARPVPLPLDDIALGARQNRIALDLIARCMKDNRWPGPGDENIVSIGVTDAYRKLAKADVDKAEAIGEQVR